MIGRQKKMKIVNKNIKHNIDEARVKRRTSQKTLYSPSLSFISIRFGSWEVRRLTRAWISLRYKKTISKCKIDWLKNQEKLNDRQLTDKIWTPCISN